jgi:hypothetical protein
MNTGRIENWDGAIADIGPIYPFVGSEVLMVILCVIFWIGWHVWQYRMESQRFAEEAQRLRQGNNLQQAVDAEHTLERM